VSFFLMGHAAATSAAPDPGVRAGELFEAHGRMVYALCRLILRDSTEAEDAAQQTFLSAYRSLLNGTGPDQPEAWLATIARNECRSRLARRPPSTVELLETDGDAGPDLSGIVDSRAEIEALCAAVAELPTKQREAIVLREFYGLSYREVAAALGTTGTAVESAIFKSRRSLQARLRPLRDAAGALALPLSLQDSLAQLIPGFSQAAAGGGGVALAAKLSVPFGVKALVAGLSVAAVGGTLAVSGHQGPNRVPAVVRAPLQALAVRPAAAAPPRVHTVPHTIEVARITKPVAHQFHPVTRVARSAEDTHASTDSTEHASEPDRQQAEPKDDAAAPAREGDGSEIESVAATDLTGESRDTGAGEVDTG
jgi:RNA polymerase sigma factor (sigma-70 family)